MAPSIALVAHDPRVTHRGLLRIPRDAGGFLVDGSGRGRPCVDRARGDWRKTGDRSDSWTRRARRHTSPAVLVSHSSAGFVGIRDLDCRAFGRHSGMARKKTSIVTGRKDTVIRSGLPAIQTCYTLFSEWLR